MFRAIIVCLLMFSATQAVEAGDSVELALGKASDGVDILRFAYHIPWSGRWLVSDHGELTGRHALSFNYWRAEAESLHLFAYSPVFVYHLANAPVSYIKFGIGIAYLSDTRIAQRQLGSYFQFEDQLGVGWQWHDHDLSLVYMHYSNGGFSSPNRGLDMIILSYATSID